MPELNTTGRKTMRDLRELKGRPVAIEMMRCHDEQEIPGVPQSIVGPILVDVETGQPLAGVRHCSVEKDWDNGGFCKATIELYVAGSCQPREQGGETRRREATSETIVAAILDELCRRNVVCLSLLHSVEYKDLRQGLQCVVQAEIGEEKSHA